MVKLFGIEHTQREAIYLFLIIIAVFGMFLITYQGQKEVIANKNVLVECMNSLGYAERGILPLWNGAGLNNTNISFIGVK